MADPPVELDAKRQTYVAALLAGMSQREAAEAAGISRQTAWRWISRDPAVIAAYNRERADCWRRLHDRLFALADACVASVEAAVREDAALAARVLLGLGARLPAEAGTGPGEPEAVAARQAEAARWAAVMAPPPPSLFEPRPSGPGWGPNGEGAT